MENGMDVLNKMKDFQSRSNAMKKASKEICDETIAMTKELHHYNELNISKRSILSKEKEIHLSLELLNKSLDNKISTWETVLTSKRKSLEEQEEELRKDQNDIFSARSTYCDTVNDFLKQPPKFFTSRPGNDNGSTELENLKGKFQTLEQEFQALDASVTNKESSLKELQISEETYKEELSKYEKILDRKKQILKNLTMKVKSLKLDKRQYEIENLYHQNSNRYYSVNESQSKTETTSSYFIEPEKKNVKFVETLNELHNLSKRKSNTLMSNNHNISTAINDNLHKQQFDEDQIKRCRISEESDFLSVSGNSHSFSNNSNKIKQVSEKKTKFVPKQPSLSKKLY